MSRQTTTTSHTYPIGLDMYQARNIQKPSMRAIGDGALTVMTNYVIIVCSRYNDDLAQLPLFFAICNVWTVFGAGNRAKMASTIIRETYNPPGNSAHAQKVLIEHGDFVRRILRFHVRNQVEREDLFQDFFLGLISRPIPEDVQNVRGYVYRMLCDNIKDAFRRIERYQQRLHRYAEHRKHIVEDQPENSLMETEEVEKMFELISKHLPKNEATAMVLRYRHNYNIRETAAKMGIKTRSVSRYLSVGAKKLRQVLGAGERSSRW